MCAQCEGPDPDRFSEKVEEIERRRREAYRIKQRFGDKRTSWFTIDKMAFWLSIFDDQKVKRVPTQAELDQLLSLEKKCFTNS